MADLTVEVHARLRGERRFHAAVWFIRHFGRHVPRRWLGPMATAAARLLSAEYRIGNGRWESVPIPPFEVEVTDG